MDRARGALFELTGPALDVGLGLQDRAPQLVNLADVTSELEQKAQPAEHELRSAREALRLSEERVRALLGERERLLTTLSHDLRTPLAAILGWAHLMRIRPPTSEELAKGLEIVERNARIQTQLIEDMLGMSRSPSSPEQPRTPGMDLTEFKAVDLRGVRLLVVDDQSDGCELVERVLEECGAWVVCAVEGERALALLAEHRPDVLISDIGMPEMDGYELLRRVRAMDDGGLRRIPAIAMTAFARCEDRTHALRAGYQVHLAKPVEPSELVATVASVTGRV